MKTRSKLKPTTKVMASGWHWPSTLFVLILTLVCLAILLDYAKAGEAIATRSESITAEISATVSPDYLCGGCDGDEGLNTECWFEGDICLERDDVRLYMNSRFQLQLEASPAVSKSEFVVMVYMIDYLFYDGAHLSAENLATLANQKLCEEVNIDCLSQTANRVMSIEAATLRPVKE